MINNKKVLAITLARGGSQSIYKKNIALLCGVPLIKYTIDEAKKSNYIDAYYVSTDDKEIKDYCLSQNVKVIDRPRDLSTSISTSAESLAHAVNSVNDEFDYIIELMATNPLKNVSDIDECIKMLDSFDGKSVVAVQRIFDHHPSRVKFLVNGIMQDFYEEILESRRQDLFPEAYIRCGSIYAMKKELLLENKTRYDKNTKAYIMPSERVINIDEPIDLKLAELLIKEQSNT